MNQERLLAAGVNYADGVKRFGGKPELYEKYLVQFPADTNYSHMILALEPADYDAAFKYAHALKGLAGNLSLGSLYVQLSVLVESLRAGQVSNLDPLIDSISRCYLQVTQAIIGAS